MNISRTTLNQNMFTIWWMALGYKGVNGWFTQSLFPEIYPLGLVFFLIIISGYLAYKNREKWLIYYTILFWMFYLYLFFGSQSLTTYSPIPVVDRYFITVASLFGLLGAYPIYLAWKKKWQYGIGLIILTLLSYYPMFLAIHAFNSAIL